MNLLLIRDTYTNLSTVGKLYVNGTFFCHTLEDVARAYGVKIKGETAIPQGEYLVDLSTSYRFKRIMPMIYTESNGYELKSGGISFKGIRIHGGNTHKNTDGCVLVAHNRLNYNLIQGTAEKDLVSLLSEATEQITLTIKNR